MMVPYVMIHFPKPYLEACGAIVAGVVLGSLSMKTGSIWAGFLIHSTVAILMDSARPSSERAYAGAACSLFAGPPQVPLHHPRPVDRVGALARRPAPPAPPAAAATTHGSRGALSTSPSD